MEPSPEWQRLAEIANLRAALYRLQGDLKATRTSHKAEYKDYSYPVLMGHKRELVEKELATIKVKLMLLGAKL